MTPEIVEQFTDSAARTIAQGRDQIVRCVRLLSTDELWARANEHCNSVANLVLHLTGNVRQWIVAGLGGAAFDRDRPAEFAARDRRPADELLGPFEKTIEEALGVIRAQDAASLAIRRAIQGYEVTALAAIFHVAEHLSFHAGQIIHMTKALKDVDLSLYDAQGRRLKASGGKPW